MAEDLIKILALYAASVTTILTFIAALFKSSNKAGRWLSTKIIKVADMRQRPDWVDMKNLEALLTKVEAKLDDFDSVQLIVKRLEYMNLIQHSPENERTINQVYDEYKSMGGNSYIMLEHDRWLRERCEAKRIANEEETKTVGSCRVSKRKTK